MGQKPGTPREQKRHSGPYGALAAIGEILARKVGPVPAALVLVGIVGAIAVIALAIFMRNASFLYLLIVLLAFLAVLIFLTHVFGGSSGSGDQGGPVEPTTSNLLEPTTINLICTAMDFAAEAVATTLSMPLQHVRTNIFQHCSDGRMRMHPDLSRRIDSGGKDDHHASGLRRDR